MRASTALRWLAFGAVVIAAFLFKVRTLRHLVVLAAMALMAGLFLFGRPAEPATRQGLQSLIPRKAEDFLWILAVVLGLAAILMV